MVTMATKSNQYEKACKCGSKIFQNKKSPKLLKKFSNRISVSIHHPIKFEVTGHVFDHVYANEVACDWVVW